MSFIAIGLFVLACGWKLYSDFLPTKVEALRNQGHPQYFGATLAAGYIALLAVFLNAFAVQAGSYDLLIERVARIAPHVGSGRLPPKPSEATNPVVIVNQGLSRSSLVLRTSRKGPSITPESRTATPPSESGAHFDPYQVMLGLGLWAAILALCLPTILNLPYRVNNRLNLLAGEKSFRDIDRAVIDAVERGISLAIPLTSRKVYIGFPSSFEANRWETDWISIWPLASGYRTTRGKLELTTLYDDVYTIIQNNQASNASVDDFKVTLSVNKILSIQTFSLETYASHFAEDHKDNAIVSKAMSEGEEQGVPDNDRKTSAGIVNNNLNTAWIKSLPDSILKALLWIYLISFTSSVLLLHHSIRAAILSMCIFLISVVFLKLTNTAY